MRNGIPLRLKMVGIGVVCAMTAGCYRSRTREEEPPEAETETATAEIVVEQGSDTEIPVALGTEPETDADVDAASDIDSDTVVESDTATDRDTGLDTQTDSEIRSSPDTETSGNTDSASLPETGTDTAGTATDSFIDTETEPMDTGVDTQIDTQRDTASETAWDTGVDSAPIDTEVQATCPAWLDAVSAPGLRLSTDMVSEVLFDGKLEKVVLITRKDEEEGSALESVALPDGTAATVAENVSSAAWLVRGKTLAVTHPDRRLVRASLDGTPPAALAESVCEVLVSRNGSRALIRQDCESHIGKMALLDTATGAIVETPITPYLGAMTRALAPDGRFAAILGRDDTSTPVAEKVQLWWVASNGDIDALTPAGALDGLRFLCDGSLLYMVETDIYGYTLYRYDPNTGRTTHAAEDRYMAHREDNQGYALSPNEAWVLGAKVDMDVPALDALYLIAVDGAGEQRLSDTLYPFQNNALGFYHPFAFSADGRHVFFINGDTPWVISAVALKSGKINHLTREMFMYRWMVSKQGAAVAYSANNRLGDDRFELRYVRADSPDVEQVLAATEARIDESVFLSNQQGLLYLSDGDLMYVHPEGDAPEQLGSDLVEMNGVYFTVDPTGCAVVYRSNDATNAGTFLMPLPNRPE